MMTAHHSVAPRQRRAPRLMGGLLAASLLGGGLAAAPQAMAASAAPAQATVASAPAAPHALAVPSWAHVPAQTMILRSRVRYLAAYPYIRGAAPTDRLGAIVRLRNPTPQNFPLVMTGWGIQDGFVLAELPVQTNNYFAWVKLRDVAISTTPYRVEIKQTAHRLLLWNNSTLIANWPVAVGKPSTPTPVGYFFVNAVIPAPNAAYGTVVISTSGFSQVYKTFGDGDAAIGIHGTDEDSSIGKSISHGCVRMHTRDAQQLARYMRVGTQVVIEK